MFRNLFLVLFFLFAGNEAISRTQYNFSLAEHMFSCIKEPVLHAFTKTEKVFNNAAPVFASLNEPGSNPDAGGLMLNPAPYFNSAPTPEFRKYQNSHIAPTRMITGGGAMGVGGIMLIAGYRQDTKYPWSGPSVSPSPLNVFGVLIAVVGLGLITSGYLFYLKFKKHMVMPYNKSY